MPALFSAKNRSTPVLILHGDKSVHRRQEKASNHVALDKVPPPPLQLTSSSRSSRGALLSTRPQHTGNVTKEEVFEGAPRVHIGVEPARAEWAKENGDEQAAGEMGGLEEEIDCADESAENWAEPAQFKCGRDTSAPARRSAKNTGVGDGSAAADSDGDHSGDYTLARKALQGRMCTERWESYYAAGMEDRLCGWAMTLPAMIQVEQARKRGGRSRRRVSCGSRTREDYSNGFTCVHLFQCPLHRESSSLPTVIGNPVCPTQVHIGGVGVHHPKFGLIFLNDGSVVVHVGTANLGSDINIDATW